MKQIKQFAKRSGNQIAQQVFRLRVPADQRGVLILPASNTGSLGDAAMFSGLCSLLENQNVQACDRRYLKYREDDHWPTSIPASNAFNAREFLSSGGERGSLQVYRAARTCGHFFCIGADILDGAYSVGRALGRIRVARILAESGLGVAFLGFSMRESPDAQCIKALAGLPPVVRFCCRDQVSLARFEHATGRQAQLVADLAFLMDPDHDSKLSKGTISWVAERKHEGRVVLGVNLNSVFYRGASDSELDFSIGMFGAAIRAANKYHGPIAVVGLPHDFRDADHDNVLLRRLKSIVPQQIPFLMLPDEVQAAEIKAVAGSLDFVLTARMHVAIAALGMGVPVGCITYQGKFEGLARHFQLDDCSISPVELTQGALEESLVRWLNNRDAVATLVRSRLPSVQGLSARNVPDDLFGSQQ